MHDFEALLQSLGSPDPGVRRHAVGALGAQPAAAHDVTVRVVAMLADDGRETVPAEAGAPPFVYEVATEAAATLIRWGASAESALPELLSLVAHGAPSARARAARVAAGLGSVGVDAVMALLDEPDAAIRESALSALARGLRATELKHARWFRRVLACLLDESTSVVFAADELLRSSGNRWQPGRPHPRALTAAVSGFIAEQPGAVHVLATRASADSTHFTAVRALGHLVGVTEAAEALSRLVCGSRGADLELAADALASVGPVLSQESVELLCRRLRECYAPAPCLARALAAYGERARPAAPAIVAWLTRLPAERPESRPTVRARLGRDLAEALAAIDPAGGPSRDALVAVLVPG